MREIETEIIRSHKRTLLLDMRSENLAQSLMEKVGATVVVLNITSSCGINHQAETSAAIRRQFLGDMNRQVVLLHGVEDLDSLAVLGLDISGVSYLTSHFSVERSAVEHELNHLLILLFHRSVAGETCAVNFREVVAEELHIVAVVELNPVSELVGGGVAGSVLLLLQLGLKSFKVNGISFLGGYELAQVNRESESVIERERILSLDHLCVGAFLHNAVNQLDAPVKCAKERHFLFPYDLLDESLLESDFRIELTHIAHELAHETAEERFSEAEEGVAVAHGAAKDSADDITRLHIGRKLSVGNGECNRAYVVGDDPHSDVHVLVFSVLLAGEFLNFVNHSGEDIRVVVALFALECHTKAFKAHSRVHIPMWKQFERTVSLAVILHKDEVPDFNHEVVSLVYEFSARHGLSLLVASEVDVNLRAWPAWARVTHFPEIVVLIAEQHSVGRKVCEPSVTCLGVERRSVLR